MTRRFFLIILVLCGYTSVNSQSLSDQQKDSIIARRVNFLTDYVDTLLYNSNSYLIGKIYYPHGTKENNPFYPDYEWKPGFVEVDDGKQYQLPMLKYDTEIDLPLAFHFIGNQGYIVQLDKNRVIKFNINGKLFEYLNISGIPGYYEVIYHSPQVSLLIRRTVWKKIDPLSDLKVPLYVKKSTCIICTDNSCTNIDNMKDIWRIYNDRKQSLRVFKKANKLSFRKDKIDTLLKLTQQYDTAGSK